MSKKPTITFGEMPMIARNPAKRYPPQSAGARVSEPHHRYQPNGVLPREELNRTGRIAQCHDIKRR